MTTYPERTIQTLLPLYPPLSGIEETGDGWLLGTLRIAKYHPHFSAGYSHPLRPDSKFYKQRFEFDGSQRGWAVIFRAVDPPPQTHDTDLFVGWVQPEREAEVDDWIEFLTDEIAKRLAAPSVPIEGTLRPIGRFEEFGYGYGAPSVATARGKRAPRNKAEVVKYLRGGKMFVFSPGIEKDVFDETKLSDSSSIRTDGVYSWPEVLGYYVDRYDIELPEEFEEHMRANTWTVPQNIDVATLRLPQKR